MKEIECSETLAHKIQTPGNHPNELIQHSQKEERLKQKKKSEIEFLACCSDREFKMFPFYPQAPVSFWSQVHSQQARQ